jgi:hypothetical protein
MKRYLLASVSALLISGSSFAYVPSSSITKMSLQVYGIYTSSDPTCTTGMTATVALTKTPQQINFADKPAIGSGSVPSTIACVVIVIGNNLSNGWAAGTYTGTSNGNADSACNSGGSNTGQAICGSGGSPQTLGWPQQITTDAAAIGLTLTTSSCSGSTSEIVPLVLSTNSACTGNQTADNGVTACTGVNINNYALPTSSGDATHGTKLTAPSAAGDLKFVVNPTNTLGGSGGGACGNLAAPLFSFAAN